MPSSSQYLIIRMVTVMGWEARSVLETHFDPIVSVVHHAVILDGQSAVQVIQIDPIIEGGQKDIVPGEPSTSAAVIDLIATRKKEVVFDDALRPEVYRPFHCE
jgi:hypothetical protein